jgi:hypothetical protein
MVDSDGIDRKYSSAIDLVGNYDATQVNNEKFQKVYIH